MYHQHRTPSVNVAEQWAMLDRYCEGCHNDAERAGDLAFDRLDPSRMHADAAVWETVIRKLRGGLMPPPGEPRPAAERLDYLRRLSRGVARRRGAHARRIPVRRVCAA